MDLVVHVATAQSTYIVGEPVPISISICNPTPEAITVKTQPTCSPPHMEILDSSNQVIAFETCDGVGGTIITATWGSQECRPDGFIVTWPQSTGRFAHLNDPLGPLAPPGEYRARYNSRQGSVTLTATSAVFVIAPTVDAPAVGSWGLVLLAAGLSVLAIHRLRFTP